MINGHEVYEMETVCSRILLVGEQRGISLLDTFSYEMGPVPPCIIDEYGCLRTGTKALLVKKLKVEVVGVETSGATVLVDLSQLLYHTIWPLKAPVAHLVTNMNTYLRDHYEQCKEVIAIPDKYNKLTPKDHERSRRAGVGSKTHTLSLNTELPSRDEILKNKENKRQLNDLICKFDSTENAQFVTQEDCIAHHEEADITLITYC